MAGEASGAAAECYNRSAMSTEGSATTTTILFTDLVNSTGLLQRAGDERAQRIVQGHHKLLQDAVAANAGRAVKWEGDGLMAAFFSSADAVRCAIAIQQGGRRPIAGERLEVRVGLNVGEALHWEQDDYFGTPVVIAERLCKRGQSGQILCSALVAGLLAGRQAFRFRELGELELKGIEEPVDACEVLYEEDQPRAFLTHTPFVGRAEEVARLHQRLAEARAGRGGLVMLVGEPGIGKTRTAEEFCEAARQDGAAVAWGRCYEGEWAPPYGPFVEAIEDHAHSAGPDQLREDLGYGAGPIARLVPAIRERLPDIPEPVAIQRDEERFRQLDAASPYGIAAPLQTDEERFRLLDAVSQFFIAASQRAPVVLVLDDLHWADKGTVAMLRHVARFAPRQRILLLGAYRDVELDRQHPLAEALVGLHRETNYERILLKGLDVGEVSELLNTIAEQDMPHGLVAAISRETDGNPFFIREVLLHLVETGALYQREGRWRSDARIEELGIPEGVRQVVGRRLSHLSTNANRLLTAASAFSGAFRFDVAAGVAGLDETAALDAVDEALAAQLLRPAGEPDACDFTHALIRHTLYSELSPPRQVRLHRQIAETMEQVYSDPSTGSGRSQLIQHAAELAYQYHRSFTLPGAERGVGHAIAAADRAEAAFAHDETVTFLRMALELLPEEDARRPRLLGRQALALAWALEFDEALAAARQAGDLIAEVEGADAAADYLAEAVRTMRMAGSLPGARALAGPGLRYAGERRDATWAWLQAYDLGRRRIDDPDQTGMFVAGPEDHELWRVLEELPPDQRAGLTGRPPSSRGDVLARFADDPFQLTFHAGEYRRGLPLWQEQAKRTEQQGRIAGALDAWANLARCHTALGAFAAAREAYRQGRALAARLPQGSAVPLLLAAPRSEWRLASDEGWQELLADTRAFLERPPAEVPTALGSFRAAAALANARLGPTEEALHWLGTLIAGLERASGWSGNYVAIACDAAATLWQLERTDHIEVIERNLREKVVAPDFRHPMRDGRLALAQLCALQERFDEAVEWFQKARDVLDEQGARPLRAIVDFDEALMYVRRAAPGDTERAAPLLDAAVRQFREIGMTGWVRRAETLSPP